LQERPYRGPRQTMKLCCFLFPMLSLLGGMLFWRQRQTYLDKLTMTFLCWEWTWSAGPGGILCGGGQNWGVVLTLPLTCFLSLGKSFKCSELQSFTEEGRDPAQWSVITKLPFSSETLW
jgi:hypothetical protein